MLSLLWCTCRERIRSLAQAGPNKALQPTPYSVRCAPASRRG
jgi:hypothetical protein